MDADRVVRAHTPEGLPARRWLPQAHLMLKHLLPRHHDPISLSDDLSDASGRPVDMVARYSLKPDQLESIFVNFLGLCYSAQVTGPDASDEPAPPWDGFTDVWVPVSPDLSLAGRLGLARRTDGEIVSADCIVLLPGLCGGNNVIRQRDLAAALKAGGLHVLAVETRGQGQTAVRYPRAVCTWGLFEPSDLLVVSDWLTAKPHIRRTGLVGFSWGASHALLTAWDESRPENHTSVVPKIAQRLPTIPPGKRYQAGVLVFSPVLDLEVLMEKMETPQSYFLHPVLAGLQKTIRLWKARMGSENPTGSLWDIVRCHQVKYPGSVRDILRFVRLLPHEGEPAGDKLANVRMPLLIVHAADDPVAPVQTVADLISGLKNPNVAAVVLPSGGHIGFGAYATDWYYSLVLSFFDPVCGPRPATK